MKTPKPFIERTLPKVLEKLKENEVEAVVISATTPFSHQLAALIARNLEEQEIVTIFLSAMKSICQNIKPPRSLFIRYPFGFPFGAPFDKDTQTTVLKDCVMHLKSIREPGDIIPLKFSWQDTMERAIKLKPDLLASSPAE